VSIGPADGGCLWGIRTEVVVGEAFWLLRGVQPWDCKSIAKASKVRILHLPPRVERASDLRKRRSGASSCTPWGYPNWVGQVAHHGLRPQTCERANAQRRTGGVDAGRECAGKFGPAPPCWSDSSGR